MKINDTIKEGMVDFMDLEPGEAFRFQPFGDLCMKVSGCIEVNYIYLEKGVMGLSKLNKPVFRVPNARIVVD